MNWEIHRRRLEGRQFTQLRPKGNSMRPRILSGQLITVEPVALVDVREGDIVFCRVKGRYYIHLVTALREGEVQIGNNHGRINGWTRQVFGKVTRVED